MGGHCCTTIAKYSLSHGNHISTKRTRLVNYCACADNLGRYLKKWVRYGLSLCDENSAAGSSLWSLCQLSSVGMVCLGVQPR